MPEKKTVKKRAVSKEAKGTVQEAVQDPVAPANQVRESYFESVKRKAYEFYEKRGKQHGMDRQDWFLAENELKPAAGK